MRPNWGREWSTPDFLIKALELEFGRFGLDPCAETKIDGEDA